MSKRELALLLTAIFASVAICCGLLNLALRPDLRWSFYAAGAAAMLWVWFVPHLIWRRMPFLLKAFLDMTAVSLYVLVMALASDGMDWYLHLALPVLFCAMVIVLLLCCLLREGRHSLLSSLVFILLGCGAQCMLSELFLDRYLRGVWNPGWSLVVLAVCLGVCIPLIVVRHVPSLREECRRRFHL